MHSIDLPCQNRECENIGVFASGLCTKCYFRHNREKLRAGESGVMGKAFNELKEIHQRNKKKESFKKARASKAMIDREEGTNRISEQSSYSNGCPIYRKEDATAELRITEKLLRDSSRLALILSRMKKNGSKHVLLSFEA